MNQAAGTATPPAAAGWKRRLLGPPGPDGGLSPRGWMTLSVGVAVLTIAIRMLAWLLTGSVSILSDALESFVNLAGALFALGMVSWAALPPDVDHPYGHHKAEFFSSGFEGILVVLAAGGIIWVAAQRLMHPQPLETLDLGLVLALLGAALNGGFAWLLLRKSRQFRSQALEGNARHLMTDVVTTVGVVLGLILARQTGWLWLDPVVAIAVALHILREGAHLIWESAHGLIDASLDDSQLAAIQDTVQQVLAGQEGVRFDDLLSRGAGQRQFVSMHLHVPGDWTVQRATELRAALEQALLALMPSLVCHIEILAGDMEAQSQKQALLLDPRPAG
ncbi:cation diffusion facilitator family transporter [Amphibiibacter pelophylacis]|uniref:Cation diffusion facilitator family transporter n=1 Tax=Amphibiibacter pelophylacis TaxID=1799477 RepID=A0ACC6NY21_9BURK